MPPQQKYVVTQELEEIRLCMNLVNNGKTLLHSLSH